MNFRISLKKTKQNFKVEIDVKIQNSVLKVKF